MKTQFALVLLSAIFLAGCGSSFQPTTQNQAEAGKAADGRTTDGKAADAKAKAPEKEKGKAAGRAPREGDAFFLKAAGAKDCAYDPQRQRLYVTNEKHLVILDTKTRTTVKAIELPGKVRACDISPDYKHLAVGPSTGQFMLWINLDDLEVIQAPFNADPMESGVFDLCVGSDGSVLFTMTFAGSGWVKLRRFDPKSAAVTVIGQVRMDTVLSTIGDRRYAALAEGNISSGPIQIYDFQLQNLRGFAEASDFNYEVACSSEARFVARPHKTGCDLYDAAGNRMGNLSGKPVICAAFHPKADRVFVMRDGQKCIQEYSVASQGIANEYPLDKALVITGDANEHLIANFHEVGQDTLIGHVSLVRAVNYRKFQSGRLRVSDDGSKVFVVISAGVYIFDTKKPAGGEVETKIKVIGAQSTAPGGKQPEIKQLTPTGEAATAHAMPAVISDVALAGGGRYLLVMMRKALKIAVFDTSAGKIERTVTMPSEDCLMAGGLEKMYLVIPGQNIVQRYNLSDGQREALGKFPVEGTIRAIAMGWKSRGPILVNWAAGSDALSRCATDIVDGTSYQKLEIKTSARMMNGMAVPLQGSKTVSTNNGSSFRDVTHFRASGGGAVFGLWCTSHSPQGLETIVLQGNTVSTHYQHDSVGYVCPSPDGQRVMTGAGVLSADLKSYKRGEARKAQTIPTTDPAWYLSVGGGNRYGNEGNLPTPELDFMISGEDRKIQSINAPEMAASPGTPRYSSGLTVDQRYWYIHDPGVLITIPMSNDRLMLRKLKIQEALEKAGGDYLFVASAPGAAADKGKEYVYQLDVKSRKGGVKYALEGPKGMAISESGKLTWRVPAGHTEPVVPVIITITDGSGKEIFHTFNIQVR